MLVLTLERMNFAEMEFFLDEHPRYRLLGLDEHIDNKTEEGFLRNFDCYKGRVTSVSYGVPIPVSVRKKMPVHVTFSDEYIESLATTLVSLWGNALHRHIEFLPQGLQYAPIYNFDHGLRYSFLDHYHLFKGQTKLVLTKQDIKYNTKD